MKIFVSHSSETARIAVRFKELLLSGNSQTKVFLSSDWESIRSGENWLQAIETALAECDGFVALITKDDDAKLPWIIYEVGFVKGRSLLPKIITFSGVDPRQIEFPLRGHHLLVSGDTNRWMRELSALGLTMTKELQAQFAALFEHKWP